MTASNNEISALFAFSLPSLNAIIVRHQRVIARVKYDVGHIVSKNCRSPVGQITNFENELTYTKIEQFDGDLVYIRDLAL